MIYLFMNIKSPVRSNLNNQIWLWLVFEKKREIKLYLYILIFDLYCVLILDLNLKKKPINLNWIESNANYLGTKGVFHVLWFFASNL